jgi:formylglycine-generating enzyme required for sulfatase activity/DNA-directed RNA polymerase subunit E'/Rpb7/DNA-binding transcriptional regulator YdaS (Cro superfamily)
MNDEHQQPEKARTARDKLDRFLRRFEPSHLDLALHSSLPLVLTPELVNHLRTEFLLDSAGWVAEADLLLSDLCREIGYEMYLMDSDVRSMLRDDIRRDQRFGPKRMREIARRVCDYLDHLAHTDPILRPEDLQSQRWTAMFYLDDAARRRAAAEMVDAINRCTEMTPAELAASGSTVQWAEMARLANLIRQMAEQLRGDYDDLIEYGALARQVAAARAGEIPLSRLPAAELSREFRVAGKRLASLDSLVGEIEREQARARPKPEARRAAAGSLLIGEIVAATVEKADFLCVVVNLDAAARGVAPVTDFLDASGRIAARQGDRADVIVTDLPDEDSRFGVSRVAALRAGIWQEIESAYAEGRCVIGRLTDLTRHGAGVDVAGFRGFLPIKEFERGRAKSPKSREQWLGKEVALAITECDRAGYHLQVSRIRAIETEAALRRERLLAGIEEGVVIEGRVKRAVDYGAFVDIGGFDGLLHKSEMSWARFDHPRDIVREDERIAVKILGVDRERDRIGLGRRQLLPDPWEEAVIVSLDVPSRKMALSIKDLTQPPPAPDPARIELTAFDFRTVKLDQRGRVIEDEMKQARFFAEELAPGVDLEMVEIPGGKFLMGTSDEDSEQVREEYKRVGWEADWIKNEMPQHEVTVSPFYIGKLAVTQRQWRIVAGWEKAGRDLKPDPSHFKDRKDSDDRPVEQVSWDDAVEFCAKLSQKTGKRYRLPTEAEWEYACRARTTTPFAFGETITHQIVNYSSEYPYAGAKKAKPRNETVPAGSLGVANGFGLYDMHGNVWEWCSDWYGDYPGEPQTDPSGPESGTWRVLRGGSWALQSHICRSAFRDLNEAANIYYTVGFRVVVSAARTK